ncbi:hypothetical protein ACWDVX_22225 [Streptomyces tendae]
MSAPNRDVRAVVEAVDRLTTQVKRLADAQSTPVAIIRDGVTTPLDAPTTADDGPRCVCGDPIERWTGPGDPGWIHSPGLDTPCLDARPKLPPMDPVHILGIDPSTPEGVALQRAPADAEDALRTARRDSIRNLLNRIDRYVAWTPAETELLRQHVETELRDADTARAVAAGNKRHVQLMHEEVQAAEERARKAERAANLLADSHRRAEQAQAALERVRAVVAGIAHPTSAGIRDYDLGRQEMATAVIVALTDTDQPTTKEN